MNLRVRYPSTICKQCGTKAYKPLARREGESRSLLSRNVLLSLGSPQIRRPESNTNIWDGGAGNCIPTKLSMNVPFPVIVGRSFRLNPIGAQIETMHDQRHCGSKVFKEHKAREACDG